MHPMRPARLWISLLLPLAALPCRAQPAPPPAASAPASASAGRAGDPHASEKRVIEDDRVRIEETRQRGQTQRITVQNKGAGALAPYEIVPAPPGQDPSQERGAAGKRTWSVLDF